MVAKRTCENCRIAKEGAERILAKQPLMEGISTSCVTCSRNQFGSLVGDMFGPRKDNWQPISKPRFEPKEPKAKA